MSIAAYLFFAAACSSQDVAGEHDGDDEVAVVETGDVIGDVTGDVREFHGIWFIGFEQSSFVECSGDGMCPEDAAEGNSGCLLNFSPEAVGQLDPALRDRQDSWSYEMMIRGARATSDDGFGHLGLQDCAIAVDEILSMERRP